MNIDQHLFQCSMRELQKAVKSGMNIKESFKKDLQTAAHSTGDTLNDVINKIYLEVTSTLGRDDADNDLLKQMTMSYNNEDYRKTVLGGKSFDDHLNMLEISCQLLGNYRVKGSALKEEYSKQFEEVLQLRTDLIGNLKKCIEKVITIAKDNIDKEGASALPKSLVFIATNQSKVAILAIERLSKTQKFSDLKKLCLENSNKVFGSSTGGKGKENKGNKNNKNKIKVETKEVIQEKVTNRTKRLHGLLFTIADEIHVAFSLFRNFHSAKHIILDILETVKTIFPNHAYYDLIHAAQVKSFEGLTYNIGFESENVYEQAYYFVSLSTAQFLEGKIGYYFEKVINKNFETYLDCIQNSVDDLAIRSLTENLMNFFWNK